MGRVLDTHPGMTPQEVEVVLGAGFVEDINKNKKMMRRDYGLIEFTFSRDNGWVCITISIQLHRLAYHGASIVPNALQAAYGPFPERVRFEDLKNALQASGGELHAVDQPGKGFEGYSINETRNTIYVTSDDSSDHHGPNRGEVWGISIQ